MIIHVAEAASKALEREDIFILTDDLRIKKNSREITKKPG